MAQAGVLGAECVVVCAVVCAGASSRQALSAQ